MSYIPNLSTGQSIFALETTFQSTPGTQDPTYNPRILDGVELHQFFTTQAHYIGKYIEGIIVNTNGITFPQGWYFVLDPYLYYSSGTTEEREIELSPSWLLPTLNTTKNC